MVKRKPTTPAGRKVNRLRNASNLFKYKAQDGQEYALNLQQKKFAELYLELQGNGTEAAIEAGYNVYNNRGEINRNLAKSIASENLTKPHVYHYITILLTREGFNSENVDKQHLFLINQFGDLSAKSKGIDMYNRLRGRYPKDQLEVSIITKYQNASDEELTKIIQGEVVEDNP